MGHDHNFLSTKGPGQSARDPLAGLRATTGAAADADANARARESTYTVHVDRFGDVPLVTLSRTKLGIRIWTERPMSSDGDWDKLMSILRDG